MKLASSAAAFAAFALVAGASFANEQDGNEMDHKRPSSIQATRIQFNEMDDDRSDTLSREEIGSDLVLGRDFMTYDTDANGEISPAEFNHYLEMQEDKEQRQNAHDGHM
ncbi:hypothetical protein [Coralloluteibacterium stylophorae]|uniref:EF-hand domain-containing protein n=1 Tax=Coralloluteibacterium stylophorae TaxID=1776034 RepID=A0A8J8AXG2_9GAMM|nr:hypothetical protein [Coralloluteibacterium stylophorae]MBS7456358.1 hypothetical protein [Coralloluteibacterium stylophorae]